MEQQPQLKMHMGIKYIKYISHAVDVVLIKVNVKPIKKEMKTIIPCTTTTALLILIIFLPRAAIINVGNAMAIENSPAVETTI